MPTIVQLAEVSASGSARLLAEAGHQEVVDEVRVRAAVAAALQEREVLGVLDRRRLREPADRLREQVRVVGHLDALRDLGLGSGCAGVLWCGSPALRSRPAATRSDFLLAVGVEALAVLPGRRRTGCA